ncbi:MAG: dihydrolipoyl dehydrogenase, partial [Chloroflexota bacterium]
MNKEAYDVIVIGAGPAGYVAAIRAAQLGQKTAIIDKQWLGGVCLNVGCIPSKALLKNAEVAYTLRNRGRELGFSFETLDIEYSKAVQRSRRVSNRLTRGVGFLMKKNGVDVYMGSAQLDTKERVTVLDEEGNEQQLTAPNIVLATGAQSRLIPGIEVDGERVLTYLEAILQEHLPDSVVIIGSGAIGVEFATLWNAYGVDVTIVEMLPRLVPLEDKEISAELEKSFKKERIHVLTEHTVQDIKTTAGGVEVLVSHGEETKNISAEQALVAVGFKPHTKGLGLEGVGVETTEGGAIAIDERMATNVPGIWAIGDVTAKLMLAHVGSAQGIVCAENIAGADTVTLDYEMMPRATYCHPQIASFGLTPAQAEERDIPFKTGTFPFQANGKALGLGDYQGWVKILAHAENGALIGAHMIGPEVTELLPELTLAESRGVPIEAVARNVHAHPTL